MCRLALLNKEGINYIESNYSLTEFFNYLEASQGGDGNGCLVVYDNGKTSIKKGIALTNEEITEDILKDYQHIKWVMYHTRLASMGNISNENCHPFKCEKFVLMMNGTERGIRAFIKENKTDTETILNICVMLGINITEATKNLNSVFVGYDNGRVFANRNNGSLEYLHHNSKTIIFASEFLPEQYKNDNVYISPLYWKEGEKIDIKKLKKAKAKEKTYKWKSYFLDDDYYDDDYYTVYKNYNFF